MKKLSKEAGVDPGKVFPHNFRHLFARTYYKKHKDIFYLADILGHASVNTTRIYTRTAGANHIRLLEGLKLVIWAQNATSQKNIKWETAKKDNAKLETATQRQKYWYRETQEKQNLKNHIILIML